MMPTKLLVFLLVAKLSICDDPPASTQHVPYSCGQLKLTKVEKSCLWPFCDSYKLHFYDLTNTNETISSTANNIKCTICKHGEESCSSQPCNQLQFNCIKTNRENNNVPSPTHTIVTYPTTTANELLLAQSEGQVHQTSASVMALGIIIGLLSSVVLFLITGWTWTYWTMKKRLSITDSGTGLSQHSNGYSTPLVHYENSSLNKDVPSTTNLESSTNYYTLLSPEKETNSGRDGGRDTTTAGEEEYCLLDRGSGKMKTTARQQREQLDGYSRLFSN